MVKNKKINKVDNKKGLKAKNLLLVFGLIYLLITILAVVSYASSINNRSDTPVTFINVMGAIWWQILMIALFIVTYFLYSKKQTLGALLECIMGLSMLANVVISIVTMGPNGVAIVIELIYPALLVAHGLIVLNKLKDKKKNIVD